MSLMSLLSLEQVLTVFLYRSLVLSEKEEIMIRQAYTKPCGVRMSFVSAQRVSGEIAPILFEVGFIENSFNRFL